VSDFTRIVFVPLAHRHLPATFPLRAFYFPLSCKIVMAETAPLVSKPLPKESSTFAVALLTPGTETVGAVV
jgi:hypothetical protein